MITITIIAQHSETIALNPPDIDREFPLMKALELRSSVKEFDTRKIEIQDLSDLLWAGNGINRPESGKRTAPSAINAQEVDIYIFNPDGVFLYNAAEHMLEEIVKGDHRELILQQEYDPLPPIACLLVSDISLFRFGEESERLEWAAMDAGIVTQNILLYCASNNMICRPRVGMEKEKIRELLELTDTQHPLLNIPVSYK